MVASVASHGGCALPQGEDNLAYAAAELSLRLWGENNPSRRRGAQNRGAQSRGARITIRKRIPMAAGLAGGSSDAAAVMLALARALAPDARLSEVIAAGASIGADVPFCVAALAKANPQLGYSGEAEARSSALCEGIGDVLSQTDPASGWAVLIKPAIEVSTPEIYAGWDALAVDFGAARTRIPDGDDPAPESVPSGDDSSFDTFRGATPEGNDLAVAAVQRYPLIGDIMDDVRSVAHADRVFMTGSGPTIVALYADETKASRDCSALSGTYKDRADIDAVILSKLL
ncbi:MAG: hypothetical protein LBL54_04545 [Clostridiales Family XIII bacterium]|nr:hypothetical protein [Clostridiales Family XIII bacterium]